MRMKIAYNNSRVQTFKYGKLNQYNVSVFTQGTCAYIQLFLNLHSQSMAVADRVHKIYKYIMQATVTFSSCESTAMYVAVIP